MKLLFYSRSRFARRAFSVKSLFSPSFFPPKLTAIKGRCGKVKARQFSDQLQRREALEDTHIKEEQTRRDESDIFVSNPWLTFANKDFPVTLKRLSYFTIINENQIDMYSGKNRVFKIQIILEDNGLYIRSLIRETPCIKKFPLFS